MFRAQANPMDEAVNKATDENLTSENWEYILDVCDKVTSTPSGPQHVVSSLIKRLAHRNANVQLYTLELANALSQNCGTTLHREIASKAFTDALLRLAGDRTTHGQVKQKVLERMGTWTQEFRSNPELGIMEQAYNRLRAQQPGLMPPSKPTKMEISVEDRRKEEEELQMALALSIKDKGTSGTESVHQTVRDDSEPQPAQPQHSAQSGTTAATVSRVRALYDFTPSEPGELAFSKGDVIAVLESVYKDWWRGSLRGQSGIFPLNYVEKLQDPTKEELERDAQMEGDVFAEIKNVEKLLALLSVRGEGGGRRGEREEEEISQLYQRTLSIRPKLIELIGKYSQKKDDFTQLNEKFIKARRDYEALLESSMSQPQYQQQYPIRGRPPTYPPQQAQAAFGHPHPSNYPPQHAPPNQGYSTQSPFPQPSQQHRLPPQDAHNYYASANTATDPTAHPGPYGTNYAQASGMNPAVGNSGGGPAPFHFIPGGIQTQSQDIRRKPSPNGPPSAVPGEPFNPTSGFQGQIRPNSIHTLNSGNPSELATGGYESPVDKRQSYPPPHTSMISGGEAHPQHIYQGDGRSNSLDSGHSAYPANPAYGSNVMAPPMPSGAPPGVPSSPSDLGAPSGTPYPPYQAYQPTGQRLPSASGPSAPSGDPGDFYR